MPAQLFQIITIAADILIVLFVANYFLKFEAKEKALEKKEEKIDTNYHQVVDTALTRERKIIEDATVEAKQIIQDAHTTTHQSEEAVNQALKKMVTDVEKFTADTTQDFASISKASKIAVAQALQKMVSEIQQETVGTSHTFMNDYQNYLKKLAIHSLKEFQMVTKAMESDLQHQIKDFHASLLPAMQKELEEYKQTRLQEADQTITKVVQKVSQEILNKSISVEDHQQLLVQSLEKAKNEGMFD